MSNFFHLFLFSSLLTFNSCQSNTASLPEPVSEEHNPVEVYLQFLRETNNVGIHNHTQLIAYIEHEEQHFCTFLEHIDEYQQMDLTELTTLTERICQSIYLETAAGNLDSLQVQSVMARRINRRLLSNALAGYDLLKEGKANTPEQTQAYLWMMLQPFFMLDSSAVALLTDAERKQLQLLANETPVIIDQLSLTK